MYGTFYSIEKVTKDAAPKILFKKPPTIFEKQQLPKFRQCDFLQCRKSERINGLRRMYLLANALLIFPIPFSILFFFFCDHQVDNVLREVKVCGCLGRH